MKVRIKSCEDPTWGYFYNVGEILEVKEDPNSPLYFEKTSLRGSLVLKTDCEIIPKVVKSVRILKCSDPDYWYAGKIGEVFKIEEVYEGENFFSVLNLDPLVEESKFILKEDCIIWDKPKLLNRYQILKRESLEG